MRTLTVDRMGIALSALCVMHCLLLPVLASVLPLIAVMAEDERIHKALVLLAIIPAVLAFTMPLKTNHSFMLRAGVLFGILTLLLGAFAERLHDFETALTVIGGLSLAFAHVWRVLTVKSHIHEIDL